MTIGFGWIGMTSQVEHFLSMVGADRDEQGKFLLVDEDGQSQGPTSFMGAGVEMVIPATTCYLVKGQPMPLAAGLRTTSYGMGVVVI